MNDELLMYPDIVTARSLAYNKPSSSSSEEGDSGKNNDEDSFGGKAMPRSYTRLYLRAADEIVKKMSADLAKKFRYDLTIPVSPSELEYKRDADHTEVYSIVKGGMLQRNLPKLWTSSITSYVPKYIMERAFHNYFIMDREDTAKKEQYKQAVEANDATSIGQYSQQMFVDYVNLIMDYKVPMELWDESSPVRIKHQPKYFCITNFTYKMMPYDDIEMSIDLIEWKEPVVLVKDLVTVTDEKEDKPPVKGGSGNTIMAFGVADTRKHNNARVYRSDLVEHVYVSNKDRTLCSTVSIKDFSNHIYNAIKDVIASIRKHYIDKKTAVVIQEVRSTDMHSDYGTFRCRITMYLDSTPPASKSRATLQDLINMGYAKEAEVIRTNAKIGTLVTAMNINMNKSLSASLSTEDTSKTDETTLKTLSGGSVGYGNSEAYTGKSGSVLGNSAWCKKIKTLKNVKEIYQTTSFVSADTNNITITQGSPANRNPSIFYYVTLKTQVLKRVWYKTMYILQPIAGKDKVFNPNQTFLCPKENTIVTSYQNYIDTFNASFSDKKTTRLIDTKEKTADGTKVYYNDYTDQEIATNLPITKKTGKKIPANVSGRK